MTDQATLMTQDKQTKTEAVSAEELNEVKVCPKSDIYRSEDAVRVLMDLPGASLDDLDVRLHDGVVTVTARVPRADKELRVYTRSFRIDQQLDVAAVEASLSHGVLTLRLPVHEASRPRAIDVKAG